MGLDASVFFFKMPILPLDLLVTMMWTYITTACRMRCLPYFVMPLVWRNTMTSPETLTIPDLLTAWDLGKLTALDITITSPLCPAILGELCHQAGAAALAAEACKLHSNGPNARSWAGPAFHWQWSRRQGCCLT